MICANSCGEVIDISRLPRAIATNSVPCLNSVAFQCGSNVAKPATAGPNTSVIATARASLGVIGPDMRMVILSAANTAPEVATSAPAAALASKVRRLIVVMVGLLPEFCMTPAVSAPLRLRTFISHVVFRV
ncbi:hypothetical protein GALL_482470 [mine drainage metagenome]|uniref:Uncharacterized protein n=1 Tax=mine drainage metagenome TaxID=410659 RepID=A0A1J5PFI8_9ZZZZ